MNDTIYEGMPLVNMPPHKPFAVNVYTLGYGYPHMLSTDPQHHAGVYSDMLLYRVRVYPKRQVYQ